VRFVASTLLDAVRKAETAPESAARAHAYLCTLESSLDVVSTDVGEQGISSAFCRKSKEIICLYD